MSQTEISGILQKLRRMESEREALRDQHVITSDAYKAKQHHVDVVRNAIDAMIDLGELWDTKA
jgi:hypothetical protein